MMFLVSGIFAGESLKRIVVRPRHSYSETLRFVVSQREFGQWPGYITISGEFLKNNWPDTVGIKRLGKGDLRIPIP